ncbi:hypothetical protein C4J81_00995 [Deltaproteobacteria bacterium Smac51]|nr:hypothetical protein C4J81_00995 [Deltaproteobacteria bacterium Smac51]
MKKKTSTIFSSILTSSLLPFAVVFILAVITVSNVVYKYSKERIHETVGFSARHVSEKVVDSLISTSTQVRLTSMNLAVAARDTDAARHTVDYIMTSLMDANRDIRCAWYVFSDGVMTPPGAFSDSSSTSRHWYEHSFLRDKYSIHKLDSTPDEELNDPKESYWHLTPFETGMPYQDNGGFWDYETGNGAEYLATIAYPIVREGTIIGTVGMDITYSRTFRFLDEMQAASQGRILLISENGMVAYSSETEEKGLDFRELGFQADEAARMADVLENEVSFLEEIYSPFFGEKSLVYFGPIVSPGMNNQLHLYVDIPISILYGEMWAIIRAIAVIGVAGLLILTAGAVLATRKIVTPIRHITDYATSLADGNLDACSEDIDRDISVSREVEALQEAVKKMLTQLGQNHELKIYAMRAEMEKQQAEEASQERTRFFATMSHEIRTPMNAIMGISDILLAGQLTEEQSRHVLNIKNSSDALLVIINDILDISKLDSGKLNLVNSHFDFNDMLESVASLIKQLSSKKNIKFSTIKGDGLPVCLYGDEVRIRQILMNLLGNAIKFTERGQVSLTASVEKDMLRFDISDTGRGIKADDFDVLFQAFKQVDEHNNRRVQGTGLGLSISMNLAKLMGGDISLDSVYGRGSTFTVRIPLKAGDQNKVRGRRAKNLEGLKVSGQVLLVDDNELNLTVAAGLIKLFGITCDTAESGFIALEKVQAHHYDLIFMDHMMPDMNGLETTQKIRELGGWLENVPIVALTANAVAGAREMMLASKMDDFLSKPIRKIELAEMLMKWLPVESGQQ